MISRSFSQEVQEKDELFRRISLFVARGCEKLRNQNMKAQAIEVFIRTSPFKPDFYQKANYVCFDQATNDTFLILKYAKQAFMQTYLSNKGYKKAGILLTGLTKDIQQISWLTQEKENPKVLQSIDYLNQRFGKGVVTFGICGSKKQTLSSLSKRDYISPAYTTKWTDLPKVK